MNQKFPQFAKDAFAQRWPAGSLTAMHASNPATLDWEALQQLTGLDLNQVLAEDNLEYASSQGDTTLLKRISEQHGYGLKPEQLLVTVGAQEAIFVVMQALLGPGDHAIGFTPCFEPLLSEAQMTGADVSAIPLCPDDGWSIDWDRLEQAFQPNTKLLIINFPHNPTGTHITPDEADHLIGLCQKHQCWLFSDEVFRGLEHQPEDRIEAIAAQYDRGISMGVMSKSMALPGIRLGWLAAQNTDFIQTCLQIKKHLSICPSALDVAISRALMPHAQAIWNRNTQILNQCKDALQQVLNTTPTLQWIRPQGSATGFIQTSHQTGKSFAIRLANQLGLLVIPNQGFLTEVEGFRITIGSTALCDHYPSLNQSNLRAKQP